MTSPTDPLALSAWREADDVVLHLTNARGMARLVRRPLPAPLLAQRSVDAQAGCPVSRRWLWDEMFATTLGPLLEAPMGRPLNLQLALELDAVAWELASPGDQPLGVHFAVSRHMGLFDEAPPTRPTEPATLTLRVLALGSEAEALVGPWGRGGPGLRCRVLPATELGDDSVADLLGSHELLVLDAAAAERLGGLWSTVGEQRVPGLTVVCGMTAAGFDSIRQLSQRGSALLSLGAGETLFFEVLVHALMAGVSVAEAVRRARERMHHSGQPSAARLYGPADQALSVEGSALMAASHRQVTNLSFDLVGSTRMVDDLGNERYTELLDAYHAACAATIERHGGTTRDPQGSDGAISFFGHPRASENAAANAVAAGLEIVQTVTHLGVRVRVGITTGQVAVRNGQPVDESIHLADRLQKECAQAGEVVLDELTRVLVAQPYDVESLGARALSGVAQAKRIYRVLRRSGRSSQEAMAARAHLTPFVGRDAELLHLIERWERVLEDKLHVTGLLGEAGMGKSRLVFEFRHWLARQGYQAWVCHGSLNAHHSPLLALAQMLRDSFGVHAQDDARSLHQKVSHALSAQSPDDDTVMRVAELIAPRANRPPSATVSERALYPREATLNVLADYLVHVAHLQPLCLVIEDAHWLDPSTREFLALLLPRMLTLPVLVLTTARSGPGSAWVLPVPHEVVELQGLSPGAARELAREACGTQGLPLGVLRLLASRSDGVPLFLEESVQMAVASSASVDEAQHTLRFDVPSTLQGLLMARLDSLGEARVVAQLGAVLGREFREDLLRAVVAQDDMPGALARLSSDLNQLECSGLLRCAGEGDERRWVFKHALVRDVAYQSLWAADRQRLHRHVAEVLTTQFSACVGAQPELLARHQTEAGLDTEALAQWERAARLAAQTSAHEEAIHHIDSALRLLEQQPPGAPRDRFELRLQLLSASRYIAIEGYGAERVERLYARAAELCETLDDRAALFKVELGRHGWHFMRGDLARAQKIAQACAESAATSHDPLARMQADWAVALTGFHLGDAPEAVRRMDACLAAYHRGLHHPGAVQDPGVMCLCYSAWAQWELGHIDDALQRVRRLLALAESLDHTFSRAEAHGFASSVHLFRGETDTALAHAERAIELCEESGFAVWLAHALVMRGRLRCGFGQFDTGLADIARGVAMWVGTGASVTLPMYLALQAEGLALAGRPSEGLDLLARAAEVIERTGERYHQAEVLRLKGELLWQSAPADDLRSAHDAQARLAEALALAQAQGKHSFALRASRGWARVLLDLGEVSRARALLVSALAGMPETSETADVTSVREMMRGMDAHDSIR